MLAAAGVVPFYLHPGVGMVCVIVIQLDEKTKREWTRRHAKEKLERDQYGYAGGVSWHH